VLVDPERRRSRRGVNRALESIVGEGFHRSALAADGVVMVIAARLGRLVAGAAARAKIEAVDEPELREGLKRAVDARKSHCWSS
jgi:hypothetical protein